MVETRDQFEPNTEVLHGEGKEYLGPVRMLIGTSEFFLVPSRARTRDSYFGGSLGIYLEKG